MSSISIKGILVGTLFDLGATFVFSIVVGVYLGVQTGNVEAAVQMASSGGWLLFGIIFGCVVTVIAGYLAARIAGRGELLNGGVCAVLTMIIGLLMSMGQPATMPEVWTFLLCLLTPLLGLLGGYLRLRQVMELSAA
jgi:hypothetical protein